MIKLKSDYFVSLFNRQVAYFLNFLITQYNPIINCFNLFLGWRIHDFPSVSCKIILSSSAPSSLPLNYLHMWEWGTVHLLYVTVAIWGHKTASSDSHPWLDEEASGSFLLWSGYLELRLLFQVGCFHGCWLSFTHSLPFGLKYKFQVRIISFLFYISIPSYEYVHIYSRDEIPPL